MKFSGTKDIKHYVSQYFIKNKDLFGDKIVIDIPAGTGVSSEVLDQIGADIRPYDLFPDLFKVKNIQCKEADLSSVLPIENQIADYVLCQEGIEHIPDQLFLLKEFNRILKLNGKLIITTPNYSNLRSRFSYLASENELFLKMMPPNELDSIWLSEKKESKIYYGHLFLVGMLKLRTLAKLNGFRLVKIHSTRINYTSLWLLFFFYPWILIINYISYFRNLRKKKDVSKKVVKSTYKELLKLAIHPSVLTDCHLFVEFEKEKDHEEVCKELHSINKNTDFTT